MSISPPLVSFWKLPVRIAALVCLVTVGAVFATRISAVPPHVSLLTSNTCTLPCIFGVTPGSSVRDDAMIAFQRAAVSYSYYNPVGRTYPTHESTHPVMFMAYMYFGDPFIGDVRTLQLFQTAGTRSLGYLGDFLLAGYQPARVLTACQDDKYALILLNGQDWFLQVKLDPVIRPDAAVSLISTSSDSAVMARSMDNFGCATESVWMGFAPQWKYRAVS